MEIKKIKSIIDNVTPFLKKHEFDLKDGSENVFSNGKVLVTLGFDEEKNFVTLTVAAIGDEGELSDEKELSSWLYDDKSTPEDAKVISEDFESCLCDAFGIKKSDVDADAAKKVALPTKAAPGQTPGIDAFAQKFLNMFPQYKDTYKEHMAKYGEFLYVEFFKETAAVKLKELSDGNNKKLLSKYLDMLGQMYVEGETCVSNVIAGVIFAGAFGSEQTAEEKLSEFLQQYPYLKTAARHISMVYGSNKKFREVFDS